MNVLDYRVSLDMFDTLSQITIKAKKGDSACRILITLTEHGKIYKIGEGCYATFNAKKADGNFIFNSCTIENNTIVYDFSSSVDENGTCQVSAYEGVVECEVTLYNADSKQLTSPRFTLFIDGTVYNGEEIVSSSELGAIEKLMEKPINKHNTDPHAHGFEEKLASKMPIFGTVRVLKRDPEKGYVYAEPESLEDVKNPIDISFDMSGNPKIKPKNNGGKLEGFDYGGGNVYGTLTMLGNRITQLPTPTQNDEAVNKFYADNLLKANDAMVFKGTLGEGGTITSVPTGSAGYKSGWTYKIITAGTYAGQFCEVGDMLICINSYAGHTNPMFVTDEDWVVVQGNTMTDQTYNPQSENAQSGVALADILFPIKEFNMPGIDVSQVGLSIEHISPFVKDMENLDVSLVQIEIDKEFSPTSVNKMPEVKEGVGYLSESILEYHKPHLTGTITISCTLDYAEGEMGGTYIRGSDGESYGTESSNQYVPLNDGSGWYRFYEVITLPAGVYAERIEASSYGTPKCKDWCLVTGVSYDYIPRTYSDRLIDFSSFTLYDEVSGQRATFNSDGNISDFYVVSPRMRLFLGDSDNAIGDTYSDLLNCVLEVKVPIDRLTALESALGTSTEILSTLVDPSEE